MSTNGMSSGSTKPRCGFFMAHTTPFEAFALRQSGDWIHATLLWEQAQVDGGLVKSYYLEAKDDPKTGRSGRQVLKEFLKSIEVPQDRIIAFEEQRALMREVTRREPSNSNWQRGGSWSRCGAGCRWSSCSRSRFP